MHKKEIAILGVLLILVSCTKAPGADPSRRPDRSYHPVLESSQFLAGGEVLNLYMRHPQGKTYVYTGQGDEGEERIEVSKATETITILGITCTTIVEKIWAGSFLIEEERMYYAEETDGDVWQMGTAVNNYNDAGEIINNHTSWIAGVDRAEPGIIMPGNPMPGVKYRQEYYFNVAENQAEVVDTGITVTTDMGTFEHCIVIREWSELEPDIVDLKMYAPGIGLVKEVNLASGEELQLVDIQ